MCPMILDDFRTRLNIRTMTGLYLNSRKLLAKKQITKCLRNVVNGGAMLSILRMDTRNFAIAKENSLNRSTRFSRGATRSMWKAIHGSSVFLFRKMFLRWQMRLDVKRL